MSFSKEIDTIKYNYGSQSSIFVPGESYGVAEKISDFWIHENKFFFETGLTDLLKGTFSLEFFENDTIRLKYYRYGAENRFEEHLNKLSGVKPEFKEDENQYLFVFGEYEIKLPKKEFDIIVSRKGKKVFSLYKRLGYNFFEKYLAPHMGFRTIKNHIAYPFITFDLQNDENIYGLGEKYKTFEKRGIKSETLSQSTNIVCSTDISYSSIPLIYSTRGYAVLVNSGFKTHFEVGSYATDALSIMSEESCLDMFIFLDESIKGLITKYTALTGRISDLPDMGYGVIISRLYYNNTEEALGEIKAAKEHGFPMDIVGIDPKWLKLRYTKTCNFNFNDEAYGTAREFAQKTREMGVETSLWLNTNVQGDDTEYFKTCWEKGYLVKDKDGNPLPAEIGPALIQEPAYAIDFSNPEAYKYWQDNVRKLITEDGIRFFTADYGGGVSRKGVLHNGRSGREMKNFSQWLYPKALFEVMEEELGKGNALLYRRPGFIGAHRFAGKWGGDSFARYQEMQNQVRAGLSLAVCGEFMWGMDLGGGYRGKPTNDLTIRWNQAGAMFPFTRFHGIGRREPWYSSEEATENAKKYLNLKRTLLPYYKHYENLSKQNGLPIIRGLVLEFQKDRFARKIEDQYMIGEKIMVAPVFDQDVEERQVYFPEGNWIDFETNQKFEGGRVYTVSAPLLRLPIFVKEGTVLPMFKTADFNLDHSSKQEIQLKVFGDVDTKGEYVFNLNNIKHTLSYEVKSGKLSFDIKK